MRKALIIARKDIGETMRSRSIYVSMLFLLAIISPYFLALRRVTGAPLTDAQVLETAVQAGLNAMLCALPLTIASLVAGPFSTFSMILEKAKRTFESLLSTPVSLREVWLGKSLAVFIPAIVISFSVTLVVWLVMEMVLVVPALGHFVFPDALSLLTWLVIVPALTFFLISLVSLFQLIVANPRIPILVFSAVFLGIYFSTGTTFMVDFSLSLVYAAATLVLAAATAVSLKFLSKDRVILTSKI